MKTWRRNLGWLLAVFHSPKRTFAAIGETPSVGVVVVAMLLFLTVVSASRIIATEDPAPVSREAALSLLQILVVIGWPFVVSALYVFVFDLFGAEARYRVILSVTLHAMWAFFTLGVVLELLGWLMAGRPLFEIKESLVSSTGIDEHTARNLVRVLNPLEIGRLVLTALGFVIAQPVARWMSFAVVFAGWFGFHLLPLLELLLF